MTLDAGTLSYVGHWSHRFSVDWRDEVPIRMHRGAGQFAVDGSPEWTAEFAKWISRRSERSNLPDDYEERRLLDTRGPYQNGPERTRVTKAMRKLRRQAPAEFLVAYDLCVLHPPQQNANLETVFIGIANRLNRRAAQRHYPERYTPDDVSVLAFSAIDKINRWY